MCLYIATQISSKYVVLDWIGRKEEASAANFGTCRAYRAIVHSLLFIHPSKCSAGVSSASLLCRFYLHCSYSFFKTVHGSRKICYTEATKIILKRAVKIITLFFRKPPPFSFFNKERKKRGKGIKTSREKKQTKKGKENFFILPLLLLQLTGNTTFDGSGTVMWLLEVGRNPYIFVVHFSVLVLWKTGLHPVPSESEFACYTSPFTVFTRMYSSFICCAVVI